ncbi:MAG: hypothetical protein B6241_05295 [Spirochaetaceae bacterium 4572_59]|nr:MAG: hypothetical protein B6241_05295 [Spirochaetaceae bacterium 4572_59]
MQKHRSIAGLAEKNGQYFLAKRKPGGDLGGLWELPGGKLEAGESPSQAMEREWMEELEIKVRTGSLLCTSTFSHNGKIFELGLYKVLFEEQKMVLNEHDETGWFKKAEVEKLDLAGSDRTALALIWDEITKK